MAELLGIGLVALEIVQRGLQNIAGRLVRANDMNRVPDGVHRLLEHEYLILLTELADEHQYFLSRHSFLPELFRVAK